MATARPWHDIIKPITDRLELSSRLGLDFVYEPAGSAALAKVLKDMATIIDNEIERRELDNVS